MAKLRGSRPEDNISAVNLHKTALLSKEVKQEPAMGFPLAL